MKRILQLSVVVTLLMGAPSNTIAKIKNPTVTRYMNAAGKLTARKHKKAIRNYTHTKPAPGARTASMHVAKKYHVITGLALKSRYEKKSKPQLLVSHPKPSEPQPIVGQ
jgi:hypothetical protein